jgi:GTP-binding protein HflX
VVTSFAYRSLVHSVLRPVSPTWHPLARGGVIERGRHVASGGLLEQLFGNTAGLGTAENKALRALYRRSVHPKEFLSAALARELTEITRQLGRRIGLLVDRHGKIEKVVVGDAHRVWLPDLGARRAGAARFRGLRLVLSSLRPEGVTEEDLTDLVLLQLDAVIVVTAQADGLPGGVSYAYLLPPEEATERPWQVERRREVYNWDDDWQAFVADLEGRFARSPHLRKISDKEAAIVVGITLGDRRRADRSLDELERLAETAGFRLVDRVMQNRTQLDGKTCIGSGKLKELVIHAMGVGATALIFDRELSPSQLRNIAQETELKVLDRTQVILDIFAQHATSREGKLQVELAQLRYRMPRIAIMPREMSRLTGGIGGRGPGETKLEINRRRAQERLTRLERELAELTKNRATRRKQRTRAGIPVVSIVGYTNAGKSTLLNRMTESAVLVEDKLFATLDPTTRRFRFPEEREIVLSDTVGFIEDLPDTLVQAFKSTLEELEDADLLLHVIDASDPNVEAHKAAVEAILDDLHLRERPLLLVWNKAEVADPVRLRALLDAYGGVPVSALTGQGLDVLLAELEQQVFRRRAAAKSARDAEEQEAGALHESAT